MSINASYYGAHSITRSFNPIVLTTLMIMVLGIVCPSAHGVIVRNDQVKLKAGIAAFGTNLTTATGTPAGSANVQWDFRVVNNRTVASARVTGILYITNTFGGTVRLTITYNKFPFPAQHVPVERSFDLSAGFAFNGGLAGNHQRAINDVLEDISLGSVSISIREIAVQPTILIGAPQLKSAVQVVNQPSLLHGIRINGAPVAFGQGTYSSSVPGPASDATVTFSRTVTGPSVTFPGPAAGTVTARIRGRIYWNANVPGTPAMRIEYQDLAGTQLGFVTVPDPLRTLPGDGGPNDSDNRIEVDTTFRDVKLHRVILTLGQNTSTGFVTSGIRTINLDGPLPTGTIDVLTEDLQVVLHQRAIYAVSWTVPDPMNWHDLDSLELRILDGAESVLAIQFDEASQTLALLDETSGRIGQAHEIGSNRRLQTSGATLDLRHSALQAAGPDSPSVTLNLALSFKSRLAGKQLNVEVAARHDDGSRGNFEPAGTIMVH